MSNRIKTESIMNLSNFNFQWTKTLYQNNLNNITFSLHFSRAIDTILVICNNTRLFPMDAQENKSQILQELQKHR